MGTETSALDDRQRRVDEMGAQLASARADIEALRESSGRTGLRLDAGEVEAGRSRGQADVDRDRIQVLEDRAVIDRELVVELTRQGVLREGENRSLHEALQTARAIGVAVGIVMATRKITEVEAFGILCVASQSRKRALRVIAEEIVGSGDLSSLPEL